MIRFLLRFIGLCLLATAFVFFVYDGTKSIANQQLIYIKVGDVWAIVDQNSLNLVQDWLKQKPRGPGTRTCRRFSICRPGSCSGLWRRS